jgi:hypothetical protein
MKNLTLLWRYENRVANYIPSWSVLQVKFGIISRLVVDNYGKESILAGKIQEGTRGQGFRGPSEMLKNYIDLKVWQQSYELCGGIWNNSKISKGRKLRFNLTDKKVCCVYSLAVISCAR